MNMGKRFLLTLLLCVLGSTAFAYDNPRWFNMPISVYAPKTAQGTTVMNAYRAWQSASGGTVRFLYRNAENLQPLSNITIQFSDNWISGKPYSITQKYSMFSERRINTKRGFYYKQTITISRNDRYGKPYTGNQLYSIALTAAGESLGVKDLNLDLDKNKVTKDDITALNSVYKK
ncbi:MAG: hypothetical protein VZR09_00720 [Candidatus Gastranaerophilaceae bacterium]|nr:hypothetical protein [Candidatus Gastranaerophilaceae bacterium]